MKKAIATLTLLLCLLNPALRAWCEEHESPLIIGAISMLTGEGAAWGINHQRGTLLAAEDVNAKGGVRGRKIEIRFEDSPGGIARNAVTAYKKLVGQERVKFILGPVAMDELLAIAPLAKRDRVFIGGATYMPNPGENVFTTWIDADVESDALAQMIHGKHRKVAVLASQQSWESQIAQRFKQTFTQLGGTVVSLEEPSFDASSVRAEVLKAKQHKPDAVLVTSYLLFPHYLKEMKTLSMNVPVYGIELDQTVVEAAGGNAEGVVFIGPSAPDSNFVERFKQRWNASPDVPAASAYDAARLLFNALAERGTAFAEVVDYFRNFQGYDGVTGRIERRAGKTIISTSVYQIRNGAIERLPEEANSTTQFD